MESDISYVLLVEDNNAHARLMSRSFQGIRGAPPLKHVQDGEEAISFLRTECAQRRPPALVLLDLRLPKLGGFEVLRQVKENAILKSVPVVVLSTSDRESDIQLAQEDGVADYWVKPVPLNTVRQLLEDLSLLRVPDMRMKESRGSMIDVLLVEDDESHARLIQRAIDSSDVAAEIRHVRNLKTMLTEINRRRPDLIILDYLLPDGRGLDCLSKDPLLSDLPTIVITSHMHQQLASEAARAGVRELVSKSSTGFETLPIVIRDVISGVGKPPAAS